jgi:hypothetical protein
MSTKAFIPSASRCPHCAGTGLCAQATITTDHSHQWLECETCGKGIPAVVDNDFDTHTHRPVCSLCCGTGIARDARKASLATA